jgi:hypothetical protein
MIYEIRRCDDLSWDDINTKSHDDRFSHPINIKNNT